MIRETAVGMVSAVTITVYILLFNFVNNKSINLVIVIDDAVTVRMIGLRDCEKSFTVDFYKQKDIY